MFLKRILLASLLTCTFIAINAVENPQEEKTQLASVLIVKLYGQHKKTLITYKELLEKIGQKFATMETQLTQPFDKVKLNKSLEKKVKKIKDIQEKLALLKTEIAHCPNALKSDRAQQAIALVGAKFIGTENLPDTLEQKIKALVEIAQKLLNQINQ